MININIRDNNKNEEQENNLGTALRNKIVIKEIIILFILG